MINLGAHSDGSKEQRSALKRPVLQARAHVCFPPNHYNNILSH